MVQSKNLNDKLIRAERMINIYHNEGDIACLTPGINWL